jgi:prolyl oligopeptidase
VRGWTGAVRCVRAAAIAALVAAGPAAMADAGAPSYPVPPTGAAVDTYWGTPLVDPYRSLEDVDAPETQAWLRAEATWTRTYLDALPYRADIAAAFRAMYPAASSSETPLEQHGAFWTATRRAAGTRPIILVRDAMLQPDRVLLDENALPASDTVAYTAWSPSGRLFAYGTETNGSDWVTWHVRDVLTASDRPDVVRWSKYAGASFDGDEGFYYPGYDAPASGSERDNPSGFYKTFYHRLGTPQSADVVIAAAASEREFPAAYTADDPRYALLTFGLPDVNGYDVFRADRPGSPRTRLVDPGDGPVRFVATRGKRFFFFTKSGSPNGRVIAVDRDDPRHVARTIVPERADTLDDVSMIGERLYLVYLHDVHTAIAIADERGRTIGAIPLPGVGTATAPAASDDKTFAYYTYQSFTDPPTTYRYDVATGRSTVAARSPVQFDGASYVTEQIFARSADGTRVPVFVTHRRDMPRDGSTPTILYGYGAGGDVFTVVPSFAPATALWLRLGGAFAVVNARGGGEYGEAWHRAAMREHKQHTFDDVIAAAQLLIDRGVTARAKLALSGASWGGLMAGAVVVQRPDLFAAATSSAGIYDMVRFPTTSAGAATATEMGRADESERLFRALYAYSPLQNVRAGTRYPAMLIATGDHDDRVPPSESYKFAAALQHAQASDAPILLRVTRGAGHDYGAAGSAADALADRYAFLFAALHVTPSFR